MLYSNPLIIQARNDLSKYPHIFKTTYKLGILKELHFPLPKFIPPVLPEFQSSSATESW